MPDFATIIGGLTDALTLTNLLYIIFGVAVGQIVGAIPGMTLLMALAIAIPLTYTLDTLTALAFLISVNKGGTVGGAIPAILINTPGTPESAATALDGHPMAKKGRPMKAMKYSLYYSVFGDISSDLVLITISAPLALVALRMGPIEITALMILAFTVITGLVGNSMVKGLMAAALGFLFASVGIDPGLGTPRFTFGSLDLYDGLPLTAMSIGLLAVSEIFRQIAATTRATSTASPIRVRSDDPEDRGVTLTELLANKYVAIRAFVIGTVIGAIPGLGSATAGFLSYSVTKQAAKDPESFGKGDPRGIAASEAANSAVVGANLIPLLTLGIPGNIAAALLVSAFIIHGVQPGPLLFEEQGRLIYGLFGAMLIANFCNLGVGQVGMRIWSLAIAAPNSVVYPAALLLCITGAYVTAGSMFGVYIMLAFGVLGYFMQRFGFSVVAFIIGYVLTPELESKMVQSILISRGDPMVVFQHPIALVLLALSVVSIVYLGPRKRKPRPEPEPVED
ncbi:MAG: Tricarboxylate transporter family protein [Martelella sp.]|uniref:tripartite tricarboxylate transporter permease n=1 Tax=unclassified Martelella TaxID=2629616 RepID=UPI000C53B81C|nr:tripartite tricarboxylate transporter permease [Martelella sp.]MAU19999.1 Tricarboxylate transporter family protein [Martelella sp.]